MSLQKPNLKSVQKLLKPKKKKKSSHKIGLPPASLIFTGDKKQEDVFINLITYSTWSSYNNLIINIICIIFILHISSYT